MCPCTPCTVSRPLRLPRRPFLMVSPKCVLARRFAHEAPVDAVPAARFSTSTTRRVPSTDGPSSSLVIRKAIVPLVLGDVLHEKRLRWRSASPPVRFSCRRHRARRAHHRGFHGLEGVAAPFVDWTRLAPRRCGQRSRTPARRWPLLRPQVVDRAEAQVLDCQTPGACNRSIRSAWQPLVGRADGLPFEISCLRERDRVRQGTLRHQKLQVPAADGAGCPTARSPSSASAREQHPGRHCSAPESAS